MRKPPFRKLLFVLLLLAVIGVCAYSVGRGLWADHHFSAAQEALRRSDLAAARTHLLKATQVRPDHPDVIFLLARTARRAGDTDEALRQLRRSEQRGAVAETVELERLLLTVQQGDVTAHENRLWAYVEKDHPEAVAILEALGKGYLHTFRLEPARAAFDGWAKREPDNPEPYLLRGKASYHLRGFQEASEDYRKAVDLAPEDAAARQLYADSLISNARPAEALEQFDCLLKNDPGEVEALLGRARSLLALGRTDDAGRELDTLIAARPRSAVALLLRGKAALALGQPEEALRSLERAADITPYEREVVHNLALCLRQLDRADDAQKWSERLKRIEQDQARLAELTLALHKTPGDASIRAEIGSIFFAIDDDREGLRWLQSALQEDPRSDAAHRTLRDHYRKKGRPDLARAHEQALLKK